MHIVSKSSSKFTRLHTATLAAAFAVGIGASGQALAAAQEATLASAKQALAYCKSGAMKNNDVAYFNGSAGEAQFGPSAKDKCAQKVPTTAKVTKALVFTGTTVSECKMASAKQSQTLCNAGGVGEWDIDYILGPVATVIGGPGYGCGTSITTGGIGNAICK
jgi:hypothetical protein